MSHMIHDPNPLATTMMIGGCGDQHTKNETHWIDAWIRWERNSKAIYNDDDDDDDNDDDDIHLVPTDTFTFRYPRPATDDNGNNNSNNKSFIDIELRGFPSESEQTWNSTGLTLWCSSQHLCDYLIKNVHLLQSKKRILELGSGLGRCGLLASQLMSKDSTILLTDGDTNVLAQLRDNIQRNADRNRNNITCQQLLWGRKNSDDKKDYTVTDGDQQSTYHDEEGEEEEQSDSTFDVIFGSDLIYVPAVIEPLFETVRSKLCRDSTTTTTTTTTTAIATKNDTGGVFIMAHCTRRHCCPAGGSNDKKVSVVTIDMVLQAAGRAGLTYQLVDQIDDDISIYTFYWKKDCFCGSC